MKKFIVCTTINPLTEALALFDQMPDWNLIVIGDKKTPDSFTLKNGYYMTCEEQEKKYPKLSNLLGWNTGDRRNIGFVEAYRQGADVLAMVDDDNIPLDNWGEVVVGKEITVIEYDCPLAVFDPLWIVGDKKYWHRGFPLHLLKQRKQIGQPEERKIVPMVQVNLWNGDPDVDAIVRLTEDLDVKYDCDYWYTSNAVFSPFDMQNTIVHRDVIPYLVSIPFTGRMGDIWGAYYLQAVKPDFRVVYGKPNVNHIQKRSTKSIMRDLLDEQPGYRNEYFVAVIDEILSKQSRDFIREYRKNFENVGKK